MPKIGWQSDVHGKMNINIPFQIMCWSGSQMKLEVSSVQVWIALTHQTSPTLQKCYFLSSLNPQNILYPPNLYTSHSLNYPDLIHLCSPHLFKLTTLFKYLFHHSSIWHNFLWGSLSVLWGVSSKWAIKKLGQRLSVWVFPWTTKNMKTPIFFFNSKFYMFSLNPYFVVFP